MPLLITLNWSSQTGKAHPNVFTVSYLPTNYNVLAPSQPPFPLWSRQSWWLQKEPTWMKHQGTHQGREADRPLRKRSVALQHTNMQVPALLKTPCLHKNRSVTIIKIRYFLDFVYPTKLLETQKYSHPWQCRKPQVLMDNVADYPYCFTTEYK